MSHLYPSVGMKKWPAWGQRRPNAICKTQEKGTKTKSGVRDLLLLPPTLEA